MSGNAAELVRERITRDPCLSDCLARGIVNISELARQIAREIRETRRVEVNPAAAKIALHRLAKKLKGTMRSRVEEVLSKSTIIIHDSVTILTFPGHLMPKALSVTSQVAENARFIQVTQGFKQVTLVVSSEDVDYIVSRIGKPLERIDEQTAVVMVSPEDIITTPGVIAYITSYLAGNGVNITQIISCYVDTIIVVDSRDALKTYNLLRNLVYTTPESNV
ncbi:MAG: ACT domain-containing protein [Desulfurococcales archaeon]|nr:ACT domain-containing protein [Desulfurococcales archaeon]